MSSIKQARYVRFNSLLLIAVLILATILPAMVASTTFAPRAHAAESIAVDTRAQLHPQTEDEDPDHLSIDDLGVDPTRIVAWPKPDATPEEIEDSISEVIDDLDVAEQTEIISNPDEDDEKTLVIVESDPEATEGIITELMDSGLYDIVDFDVLLEPLVTYVAAPNDPYYSSNVKAQSSWALNAFPGGNFSPIWPRLSLARGNPNTAPVAVLDTGFDMNVEDRGANIVAGYDFGSNRASVIPQSNASTSRHGTATAGVIGAATNNKKGVAGAAWDNKVIVYKVADADNNIYLSAVTNAIFDVTNKGNARIINMSLGGVAFPSYLKQAIDAAIAKDILVIASAGNSAMLGNQAYFPANYTPVFSIASIGQTGQWSPFSTYNSNVDMAAPGEMIATLGRSNQYTYLSGTSFSAPHVAAAAALVWRASPELSSAQVQSILIKTARPVGTRGNQKTGAGALDAAAAFETALGLPHAPKITKLECKTNGVKVSWTRDTLCTNPSTGYILQYRANNHNTWTNVTVNTKEKAYSYTVTGLKENTKYLFRVATVNSKGKGPFSPNATGTAYPLTILSTHSTIKIKRGKSATIRIAPHYNVKKNVRVDWSSSKPKVSGITTTGRTPFQKGRGYWKAYTLTDTSVAKNGKKITIKGQTKGTSTITISSGYAKKQIKVVVY